MVSRPSAGAIESMGDWRGCAALCLLFDESESWPPEPETWREGRVDLERLAARYDEHLPLGWESDVDWYLETDEAAWCLRALRRRLQKNEEWPPPGAEE